MLERWRRGSIDMQTASVARAVPTGLRGVRDEVAQSPSVVPHAAVSTPGTLKRTIVA